jgi:hypothetical protein
MSYFITSSYSITSLSSSYAPGGSTATYTSSLWGTSSWTQNITSPLSVAVITASIQLLIGVGGDNTNTTFYVSASNKTGNIIEIDDSIGNECFVINSSGSSFHSGSGPFPLQLYGNINNESEMFNTNLNSGNTASTDIVMFNNLGNTGSYTAGYYIDLGINSSGYTYPFIGSANDSYIFSSGSGASGLYIGQIDSKGSVKIFAGNYLNSGSGLTINASSITASYLITGSITNALTASSVVGTQPYVTLTTSSTNWITCSFNDFKEYISLTTALVYNFTCSNPPASNQYAATSLFISNTITGQTASLSFPSSWTFIGLSPTYITASKNAYLNIESFGGKIVAVWGAQY